MTESFEHYASCRTKKRVHIDLDKQQPDTSYGWGVEGTDSMYSVRGATTVTTLYNEGRQPTDMLFHDGADNLLSRVELIYDKAGNLVEEAQTNVAETLRPKTLASLSEEQLKAVLAVFGAGGEPIRRLHKYDHQGRRIETLSGIPSLGANYQTFAYNEFEDKSEEILEQEDREYEIDDQGQLSASPDKHLVSRTEFRFSYEYDAWGNWLRKTVKSHSGADQDFTLSSTEERTLEYFA